MSKISVMVVDDHPVVLEGLRAILKQQPDMELIGKAGDGLAAVALVCKTRPDVVIMDVSLPRLNGAEATRRIRKSLPSVKVLALSSYDSDELVEHLTQAGASGYLIKATAANELAQAIRTVHSGRRFYSYSIARRLNHRLVEGFASDPSGAFNGRSRLTKRQAEVLQMIAEGLANKQIAAALNLSIKTVEKHRQQLMDRLNVHDIAGLTRYAVARRMVGFKDPAETARSTPGLPQPQPAARSPGNPPAAS